MKSHDTVNSNKYSETKLPALFQSYFQQHLLPHALDVFSEWDSDVTPVLKGSFSIASRFSSMGDLKGTLHITGNLFYSLNDVLLSQSHSKCLPLQ